MGLLLPAELDERRRQLAVEHLRVSEGGKGEVRAKARMRARARMRVRGVPRPLKSSWTTR